eukprot:m51a1_g3824 hypothetical protein (972) ;mRNA; f:290680-294324
MKPLGKLTSPSALVRIRALEQLASLSWSPDAVSALHLCTYAKKTLVSRGSTASARERSAFIRLAASVRLPVSHSEVVCRDIAGAVVALVSCAGDVAAAYGAVFQACRCLPLPDALSPNLLCSLRDATRPLVAPSDAETVRGAAGAAGPLLAGNAQLVQYYAHSLAACAEWTPVDVALVLEAAQMFGAEQLLSLHDLLYAHAFGPDGSDRMAAITACFLGCVSDKRFVDGVLYGTKKLFVLCDYLLGRPRATLLRQKERKADMRVPQVSLACQLFSTVFEQQPSWREELVEYVVNTASASEGGVLTGFVTGVCGRVARVGNTQAHKDLFGRMALEPWFQWPEKVIPMIAQGFAALCLDELSHRKSAFASRVFSDVLELLSSQELEKIKVAALVCHELLRPGVLSDEMHADLHSFLCVLMRNSADDMDSLFVVLSLLNEREKEATSSEKEAVLENLFAMIGIPYDAECPLELKLATTDKKNWAICQTWRADDSLVQACKTETLSSFIKCYLAYSGLAHRQSAMSRISRSLSQIHTEMATDPKSVIYFRSLALATGRTDVLYAISEYALRHAENKKGVLMVIPKNNIVGALCAYRAARELIRESAGTEGLDSGLTKRKLEALTEIESSLSMLSTSTAHSEYVNALTAPASVVGSACSPTLAVVMQKHFLFECRKDLVGSIDDLRVLTLTPHNKKTVTPKEETELVHAVELSTFKILHIMLQAACFMSQSQDAKSGSSFLKQMKFSSLVRSFQYIGTDRRRQEHFVAFAEGLLPTLKERLGAFVLTQLCAVVAAPVMTEAIDPPRGSVYSTRAIKWMFFLSDRTRAVERARRLFEAIPRYDHTTKLWDRGARDPMPESGAFANLTSDTLSPFFQEAVRVCCKVAVQDHRMLAESIKALALAVPCVQVVALAEKSEKAVAHFARCIKWLCVNVESAIENSETVRAMRMSLLSKTYDRLRSLIKMLVDEAVLQESSP